MTMVELDDSVMDQKPAKQNGKKGSNVCALILTTIIMLNGAALILVGGLLFAHPFVSYLGPTIGGSVWYSGHEHAFRMAFVEFGAMVTILQGGLVVFFMALTCIGITSSKHTAHCYIGTYVTCLLISLIFSGVLFIQGLPSEWGDEIEKEFDDQLSLSYGGPAGTDQFSMAFNALQKEGQCCGVIGRDDFRQPFGINFTAWKENRDQLPEPCDTVERGCLEFLQDSANLYFGLLAGFAVVCIVLQIPAFFNAMCLCSAT